MLAILIDLYFDRPAGERLAQLILCVRLALVVIGRDGKVVAGLDLRGASR